MLRTLAVTLSLTLSAAAHGQPLDCPKATTTFDMLACNKRDRLQGQAELDTTLASVRALTEFSHAKLDAAQKAWVQLADKECTWQSSDVEGGTLENVNYGGCRVRLLRARLAELRGFLEQAQPAK